MRRLKRTNNQLRQFGLPTLEERVIALEEVVTELLGKVPGIPPDNKKDFEDLQTKMDDLDARHPNNKE